MGCKGCAEKEDFKAMLLENWDLPKKEVEEDEVPPPAPSMPDDFENMPGEKKPSKDELDRLIKQMQGDFSGEKDPKKRKLLERLKKKGMSFGGGNDMTVEQLENLEKSIGSFSR